MQARARMIVVWMAGVGRKEPPSHSVGECLSAPPHWIDMLLVSCQGHWPRGYPLTRPPHCEESAPLLRRLPPAASKEGEFSLWGLIPLSLYGTRGRKWEAVPAKTIAYTTRPRRRRHYSMLIALAETRRRGLNEERVERGRRELSGRALGVMCTAYQCSHYRVEHKKWNIELVYGNALGTCM